MQEEDGVMGVWETAVHRYVGSEIARRFRWETRSWVDDNTGMLQVAGYMGDGPPVFRAETHWKLLEAEPMREMDRIMAEAEAAFARTVREVIAG